jgi:hypothetical protein
LQEWRKTGFFVPALPGEYTRSGGHEPGELYSLGDALAVKTLDILRATAVEREVLAILASGFTFWDGDAFYSVREIVKKSADDPWWWFLPFSTELADDAHPITPCVWFESDLRKEMGDFDPHSIVFAKDDLPWLWAPATKVAETLVKTADHWKYDHGVRPEHWPPWM